MTDGEPEPRERLERYTQYFMSYPPPDSNSAHGWVEVFYVPAVPSKNESGNLPRLHGDGTMIAKDAMSESGPDITDEQNRNLVVHLSGHSAGRSRAEGTLHAVPSGNEVTPASPRNLVVAPGWQRNLLDPLGWIRFFVPGNGRVVLDLVRQDLLEDGAEMLREGRSRFLVLGMIWWRSATEAAPFFWRGVRRLLPLKKLGLEDSEAPSRRPSADDR